MKLPFDAIMVGTSSQGGEAGGDGDPLDFLVDPTVDVWEMDQDIDP